MIHTLTSLQLASSGAGPVRALNSIPWPAEREDFPSVEGIPSQAVPLFEPHTRPRLRRYLLLCEKPDGLPRELKVVPAKAGEPGVPFSEVGFRTLKECLEKGKYVYREEEAVLRLAGREICLRMGLLPSPRPSTLDPRSLSFWQWCGAERLWSGTLAEAWRIGGHLVPYTTEKAGRWENRGLQDMSEKISRECGNVLHGDLYVIAWKSGCIQVTAHFKAGYFHHWPKPIPAFPLLWVGGLAATTTGKIGPDSSCFDLQSDTLDFSPSSLVFTKGCEGTLETVDGGILIQPWHDLRVLAHKSKENVLTHLPPGEVATIPEGVSRSFRLALGFGGAGAEVGRYRVPPSWYKACGVIETDRVGPAVEMASRSVALIKEHTQKGGFDTGRVWRYLRRDLRLGRPEEDGAEWEGNLAQGLFQLAYQVGEEPSDVWELYLHHAYHAADVSIYHGSWMGRLECASIMTAPLPKARFGAFVAGYLETGDPYLLDIARSVAGVYMAMEWAHQPRFCMGRDAYPLTCLMALWDYTAEPLYLDFARQTAGRLLATQLPDGGFGGQAGAGTMSGTSCLTGPDSISFGSGLLAPLAFLEWAIRDDRRPSDFCERLRRWADLMLRLQPADGIWLNGGSKGTPYTLIGAAALFSMVKASQILGDPRYAGAVRKYLSTMNAAKDCVHGTHSFLSAQYAHVADAAMGGTT